MRCHRQSIISRRQTWYSSKSLSYFGCRFFLIERRHGKISQRELSTTFSSKFKDDLVFSCPLISCQRRKKEFLVRGFFALRSLWIKKNDAEEDQTVPYKTYEDMKDNSISLGLWRCFRRITVDLLDMKKKEMFCFTRFFRWRFEEHMIHVDFRRLELIKQSPFWLRPKPHFDSSHKITRSVPNQTPKCSEGLWKSLRSFYTKKTRSDTRHVVVVQLTLNVLTFENIYLFAVWYNLMMSKYCTSKFALLYALKTRRDWMPLSFWFVRKQRKFSTLFFALVVLWYTDYRDYDETRSSNKEWTKQLECLFHPSTSNIDPRNF
jgi:hypothetical protein